MKHTISILSLAAVFAAPAVTAQTNLLQWNFNDETTNPTVTVAAGSIMTVGGATSTFASGVGSSDTSATNRAFNTSGYPAAGQAPKTAGIQININTTGRTNIALSFDQRLSNTAANTYVVQYTTNAAAATPVWVDAQTYTITPAATGTGDTWTNTRIFNFSNISGLNNNPNAAFRIVSDFAPGTGDYVAAKLGSTYASSGTVRYDMVTVMSDVTLGTNETAPKSVAEFPTVLRAGEMLTFPSKTTYEVYTPAGQLVARGTQAQEISTANLTPGLYLVKTASGTRRIMIK